MYKIYPLITAILLSAIGRAPIGQINKSPGGFSFDPITPPSSSSFSSLSEPEPEVPQGDDYFSCDIYGPFQMGGNNFDVTFNYRVKTINQSIVERMRLLDSDGNIVYVSTKTSRFYQDNALLSVTFTVPISMYLGYSVLTIRFEVLAKSTYSVIASYGTHFYPVSVPDVSYIYLKGNVYETPVTGFFGDGNTMQEINERFDFRTVEDYLNVDYYYRLNIKDIYFLYESWYPIWCTAANLRFEDHDNLFPYMTHDEANNIVLPLKFKMKGAKINLTFVNKYYVNKRTLQISDTYYEGFALTSDFYLPINGKSAFNGKTLYLDIIEMGMCKLSASFPIHYLVDKSLVGLCDDGKYCIGGGSR